ncbi:Nucleolar protein NET1 [Nakaseomyces bracarensis]|uniref:Nucleolar protein NET1 n=1 Tax=Nakaseomyces bracarensis TaxID=273131 RepID=A0ABR4NVG3_9SACH
MYKLQIVLVPPSAQISNVSMNYANGIANNSIADQSQLFSTKVNGTMNASQQMENSFYPGLTRNNSVLGFPNHYTQSKLKKFLHFTKSSNTLLELSNEIIEKCEKMYPSLEDEIDIVSLQDSNCCDLDPEFVVKDVFNVDNTVRVILNEEINITESAPVSSYRSIKRRKLNNSDPNQKYDTLNIPQQQPSFSGSITVAKKRQPSTSIVKPQVNARISTPLARQLYPPSSAFEPQNSDDEDVADRSFLPPPSQPKSPPIRISSGIDYNDKRIKSGLIEEDTVSRSATVDPDKTRQQRLLSVTPLVSTMTPNRVTLTGQRVISEQLGNESVLTFSNNSLKEPQQPSRIISGMLQIPEPKIAEMEKELLEGPSSPSNILPPKPDKIPMKKPYIEKEQYYSDDSTSSSNTAPDNINRNQLQRQTSIADNNGSPLRSNQLKDDVHLAELPALSKTSEHDRRRGRSQRGISNISNIPKSEEFTIAENKRSSASDEQMSSTNLENGKPSRVEVPMNNESSSDEESSTSDDESTTDYVHSDDASREESSSEEEDAANSTVRHVPRKHLTRSKKITKKIFQRDELLKVMEGDKNSVPESIKNDLLKLYPDFPPKKLRKVVHAASTLHPKHNSLPKIIYENETNSERFNVEHSDYSSDYSSDSLSEIFSEDDIEPIREPESPPPRPPRNTRSKGLDPELHPLKETVVELKPAKEEATHDSDNGIKPQTKKPEKLSSQSSESSKKLHSQSDPTESTEETIEIPTKNVTESKDNVGKTLKINDNIYSKNNKLENFLKHASENVTTNSKRAIDEKPAQIPDKILRTVQTLTAAMNLTGAKDNKLNTAKNVTGPTPAEIAKSLADFKELMNRINKEKQRNGDDKIKNFNLKDTEKLVAQQIIGAGSKTDGPIDEINKGAPDTSYSSANVDDKNPADILKEKIDNIIRMGRDNIQQKSVAKAYNGLHPKLDKQVKSNILTEKPTPISEVIAKVLPPKSTKAELNSSIARKDKLKQESTIDELEKFKDTDNVSTPIVDTVKIKNTGSKTVKAPGIPKVAPQKMVKENKKYEVPSSTISDLALNSKPDANTSKAATSEQLAKFNMSADILKNAGNIRTEIISKEFIKHIVAKSNTPVNIHNKPSGFNSSLMREQLQQPIGNVRIPSTGNESQNFKPQEIIDHLDYNRLSFNQQPRSVQKNNTRQPILVPKDDREISSSVQKKNNEQSRPVQKKDEQLKSVQQKDEQLKSLQQKEDKQLKSDQQKDEQLKSVQQKEDKQSRPVQTNDSDREQARPVEKKEDKQSRPVQQNENKQLKSIQTNDRELPRTVQKKEDKQSRPVQQNDNDQSRPVQTNDSDREQARPVEKKEDKQSRPVQQNENKQLKSIQTNDRELPRTVQKKEDKQSRPVQQNDNDQSRPVQTNDSDREQARPVEKKEDKQSRPVQQNENKQLKSIQTNDRELPRTVQKKEDKQSRPVQQNDIDQSRPVQTNDSDREQARPVEKKEDKQSRPVQQNENKQLKSIQTNDRELPRTVQKKEDKQSRPVQQNDNKQPRPVQMGDIEISRSILKKDEEQLRSIKKNDRKPLSPLQQKVGKLSRPVQTNNKEQSISVQQKELKSSENRLRSDREVKKNNVISNSGNTFKINDKGPAFELKPLPAFNRQTSSNAQDTTSEESSSEGSSVSSSESESSSSSSDDDGNNENFKKSRRLVVDMPKEPVMIKNNHNVSNATNVANTNIVQTSPKKDNAVAPKSDNPPVKAQGILKGLPQKVRPSLSSLSDLVSRGIPDVRDTTLGRKFVETNPHNTSKSSLRNNLHNTHITDKIERITEQRESINKTNVASKLGNKKTLSTKGQQNVSTSDQTESSSSSDSSSSSGTDSETSSESDSDSDSDTDSDSDSDSNSDSDSDSSSNSGRSIKQSKKSSSSSFISAKSANSVLKKKKKSTGFASLIRDSKKK